MINQLKNINFYVILLSDMVLFALSLIGAFCLRFDFDFTNTHFKTILLLLPYVVGGKAVVFVFMGLYRGMWRYVSLGDMVRLFYAAFFSSLLITGVIGFLFRFQGFPRSVFVLDFFMTLFFVGGFRLLIRMAYGRISRLEDGRIAIRAGNRKARRTLIIGAGDAGEKTYRELRDNPRLDNKVIGFVDDDPGKKGKQIHGVPVLGRLEDLPEFVRKLKVEELLIAIPSASGHRMRKIVELCERSGAAFRTLPGLGDLIEGKVDVRTLREVRYEDLLGRPASEIRTDEVRGYMTGRRVLVTGAGGSIGSELCRQIVRFEPEKMVLLDASEPALYGIQMEMQHKCGFQKCSAVLAKTHTAGIMDAVMRAHRPEVVFHAAAYKHVPMLETNPWEAVFHNIQGSQRVMESAVAHGVERFVLVSTDKAVRPTNVMGTSKRVAEMVMRAYQGNGTRMMAVRFGNVVGSSGSVVPLFQEQIARGGPVTVTHPDAMRYFMTIPEACLLILQAGAIGKDTEIFVLHMGTPVRISDMARDLIKLSGKVPDEDIEIVFTGLRPGEKLYEELITMGEGIVATSHDRIMVLRDGGGWKGYPGQAEFRQWLIEGIEELTVLAKAHDGPGIRRKMKEMVPEYQCQDSECVF